MIETIENDTVRLPAIGSGRSAMNEEMYPVITRIGACPANIVDCRVGENRQQRTRIRRHIVLFRWQYPRVQCLAQSKHVRLNWRAGNASGTGRYEKNPRNDRPLRRDAAG